MIKIYGIDDFNSREDMVEFVRSAVNNYLVRPSYDVKEVLIDENGIVYWLHDEESLFNIDGRMYDISDTHVMCRCGSVAFMLSYGNYELFATCTNCGTNDSVYSG